MKMPQPKVNSGSSGVKVAQFVTHCTACTEIPAH